MSEQRTVLLIDDDPNVRESLRMVIEDHGYHVVEAPDGDAGIRKAESLKPDLIICDMMMPKSSGFVVIERLRQTGIVRCPFVMLTANDSDHQRAYAEFLGVDLYLNKPVRCHQLVSTLRDFCPLPITAPTLSYASTPKAEPVRI